MAPSPPPSRRLRATSPLSLLAALAFAAACGALLPLGLLQPALPQQPPQTLPLAERDTGPGPPPDSARASLPAAAGAGPGGSPPAGVSRAHWATLGRMAVLPEDVVGSCAMPRCGSSSSRRSFTVAGSAGVPASALPHMYVIVNHRNRLPNLHRLLASSAAAALADAGGDSTLSDCTCFVLVDYASDVPRAAADPRSVCLPPWDSELPVPGTMGADTYLEEGAQAAAYASLGGCREGLRGLSTAAALARVRRAWPGPAAILNATRFFPSYTRAGLLTLGLSLVAQPHRRALVFLTDADMVIRGGWWEAMLATPVPERKSMFPIVWSGCYGANASTYPASANATGGREARGWWRTRGTGMAVAYMSDLVRAGGYGPITNKRGLYGTEDWGLEHRLRPVAFSGGRRRMPSLIHPHHPQSINWAATQDGMRNTRGVYQCTRAAGDPCGCPKVRKARGKGGEEVVEVVEEVEVGGGEEGGGGDVEEEGGEAPPPRRKARGKKRRREKVG